MTKQDRETLVKFSRQTVSGCPCINVSSHSKKCADCAMLSDACKDVLTDEEERKEHKRYACILLCLVVLAAVLLIHAATGRNGNDLWALEILTGLIGLIAGPICCLSEIHAMGKEE